MTSVLRLQKMNSFSSTTLTENNAVFMSGVSTICPTQFGGETPFQLQ
jgi:hypothetical protein